MRSFYTLPSGTLATVALAEHSSLKDAEKDLRTKLPGEYLVVEVVREATISPVPESVRVQMSATRTRTRAPRDPNAPKRERKPRKPKVS